MQMIPYRPDMTYTAPHYDVVDCDFHFYEGADAFTRYLPERFKGLVRLADVDGRKKMIVRGMVSDYIPNPTFEVVAEPGSGFEYFSGRNVEGKSFREIVRPMRAIPAFTDPDARLALMDRMHLSATVNFPTLASLIEVNFMDDPEASQALVHAFNQWVHDEWGFDHKGRILTTPVMNLSTAEGAVAELEWALERGARTVLVRPAPVAGYRGPRSPFLEFADPFWKLIEETGTPVMIHSSDSGYTRYSNDWNGGDQELRPFEPNVFRDLSESQRPIQDTIFSAVGHGMLSRFPGVRLASIECGSVWITRLTQKFETTYGKMPHMFAEHPLDVLKRALYIAPYWEDPLELLIEAIGLDHVLFNSDWPHPEGMADPCSYALHLTEEVGLADGDVARIMGANSRELLGLAA
jgi:predicted TIM-barrel fold metal-dependent hydrolase